MVAQPHPHRSAHAHPPSGDGGVQRRHRLDPVLVQQLPKMIQSPSQNSAQDSVKTPEDPAHNLRRKWSDLLGQHGADGGHRLQRAEGDGARVAPVALHPPDHTLSPHALIIIS